MTNSVSESNIPEPLHPTPIRRILNKPSGGYKTISFETIEPGLAVRITDDGHLLALDFLSSFANGDRKKASQTLARITSRPDYASLLTLRRVDGKQKSRKLLSFSNAVQLLLILPKRTVCMETRRAIAGVLTDFFEYRHQGGKETGADKATVAPSAPPPPYQFSSSWSGPQFSSSGFGFFRSEEERQIAQRQAQVDLALREVELERQRARLPIDRLTQCMESMDRCGPMSEEERRKFRALFSEQAVTGVGFSFKPYSGGAATSRSVC